MEPYVADHLHPKQFALSSRSTAFPSKVDRFQSALTERVYKAAALNARALNVLSLLTAYQACRGPVLCHPGHGEDVGDSGATGTRVVVKPREPVGQGKG